MVSHDIQYCWRRNYQKYKSEMHKYPFPSQTQGKNIFKQQNGPTKHTPRGKTDIQEIDGTAYQISACCEVNANGPGIRGIADHSRIGVFSISIRGHLSVIKEHYVRPHFSLDLSISLLYFWWFRRNIDRFHCTLTQQQNKVETVQWKKPRK